MRIKRTREFDKWLKTLHDHVGLGRIAFTLRRWEVKNEIVGDTRYLGDGVSELRIHYGPGYRVYYAKRERTVVLLVFGGDKSSQRRDIEKAKAIFARLQERGEI